MQKQVGRASRYVRCQVTVVCKLLMGYLCVYIVVGVFGLTKPFPIPVFVFWGKSSNRNRYVIHQTRVVYADQSSVVSQYSSPALK